MVDGKKWLAPGPKRRGTLEQALEKAKKQIRDFNYMAEAKAAGAEPVFAFAIAFDGKELRVMGVSASD